MDVVESVPRRRDAGRSTNLEVLQRSNCLVVFCCLVAFLCFALCLAVYMATGGLMAGFWLYVFILASVAGVLCGSVAGWCFYAAVRDKQAAHENIQAETKLLNKSARLVDDAIRRGDNVELTRNDQKGVTDVKIARKDIILAAQSARGRVVDAGRSAPALSASSGPGSAVGAPALLLPSRRLVVPAPYDLMDIFKRFPLAPDRVFLGLDGYGTQVTCDPRRELCHGAFNASSGRGKTIMVRGIETQLLKMGYEVVHADIKFCLVDEFNHDYRPIARALLAQGDFRAGAHTLPHLICRTDQIYYLLQWLAGPELNRRLRMYNRGDHSYSVFFLFLEEMLYLVSIYKDLGPVLGRLLNVGRSLGIKCFCVAQNFQVQNLKLNSGMRENFESAWFLGGDIRSAAAILDMSVKELEEYLRESSIELGKGVSIFRNNNVAYNARLLRGGMASNDWVYHLLGRADGFVLPDELLPVLEADTETGIPGKTASGLVVPAGYEKRDTRKDTGELNNGAFPGSAGIPQTDPNALGESFPTVPDSSRFEPAGDDKLVPDESINDLVYWYGKLNNVVYARQKVGLGNSRYQRHASFILRQRGYMV